MKALLFVALFLVRLLYACEQPDQTKYPCRGMTIEEKKALFAKKDYTNKTLQLLMEKVNSLNRPYGTLACARKLYYPHGYFVYRYNDKDKAFLLLDLISSPATLKQVFNTHRDDFISYKYVTMDYFKSILLADGEIAQMGAFILGSNQTELGIELIHHDMTNEQRKMAIDISALLAQRYRKKNE